MVKAKTAAGVLVTLIQSADPTRTNFDVSTAAVLTLKAADVPDDVIRAMEAQVVRQDRARVLTNQMIVDFVAAKVDPDTIVTRVRRAEKTKFDLSPAKVKELQDVVPPVPPEIIAQMREKGAVLIDQTQDPPVLAALGARMTGGIIMANGSVTLVPATETAPAKLQSPQFSAGVHVSRVGSPVSVEGDVNVR